jgi:hypothetical protein
MKLPLYLTVVGIYFSSITSPAEGCKVERKQAR